MATTLFSHSEKLGVILESSICVTLTDRHIQSISKFFYLYFQIKAQCIHFSPSPPLPFSFKEMLSVTWTSTTPSKQGIFLTMFPLSTLIHRINRVIFYKQKSKHITPHQLFFYTWNKIENTNSGLQWLYEFSVFFFFFPVNAFFHVILYCTPCSPCSNHSGPLFVIVPRIWQTISVSRQLYYLSLYLECSPQTLARLSPSGHSYLNSNIHSLGRCPLIIFI